MSIRRAKKTSKPGPMQTILGDLRSRHETMSVKEIAKLLGISSTYVYKHTKHGTMPALGIPGVLRFDPHAVADWLESGMRAEYYKKTTHKLTVTP